MRLKPPWTRQPDEGLERPSKAFGFTGLWSLTSVGARNLVNGRPVSFITPSGKIRAEKSIGYAILGNQFGATDAFIEADLEAGTTELVPGTACTFFWYGMLQSQAQIYGGLLSRGDDANGNGSSLRLRITPGGEAQFSYVDTSPAGFTAETSGAAITADIPVFIVATKAGTRVSVWCRGKTATASGGNGNLRTSGRGLALNFAASSVDAPNNGGIAWHSIVGVLPYALADDVAEEIANGPPWGVLFEPRPGIWVPAAAGATFNVAWAANANTLIQPGVVNA